MVGRALGFAVGRWAWEKVGRSIARRLEAGGAAPEPEVDATLGRLDSFFHKTGSLLDG